MDRLDEAKLETATENLGYFQAQVERGVVPTEDDWSEAIKAAEDILKLAGAR